MVNQVSSNLGFDGNAIVQSNGLPNFGVQSDSVVHNLVNAPIGAQSGFQNVAASTPFGIAHGASGGSFLQQSPHSYQHQCPISQAQCEQLLSFLKGYVGTSSGFGTQTSHVASAMTPNAISTSPQAQSSLTFTSNSTPYSSSFSGNPF